MRGQGAIMDALLFMMIASAAAGLMIYTTSLYGASSNEQVASIYNYDYSANALIALHYAKDSGGVWFWSEFKNQIKAGTAVNYLSGSASGIWNSLSSSSPSRYTFLCWEYSVNPSRNGCYPLSYAGVTDSSLSTAMRTVYVSSVPMDGVTTIILKLYY